MDIIENEEDRKAFIELIREAIEPLIKAMSVFQRTISEIDWGKINEEMRKRGGKYGRQL